MSYINRSGLFQRLSVFKSCVALAFITRTAPATVPLHPLNISLQGMWGCAVSPRKSKAGWTVMGVASPPLSIQKRLQWPLVSRSRSFDMVGRLHGQACQMAQQRPQGGVRHSIAHHRSYGATAFTGRQPIRAMAFASALALLAHCWPSPFGLGHQLHHHNEAWQTCYALR